MAQEISIQVRLAGAKNGVTFDQTLSRTLDMAGDEMIQNVQDIGTATEALLLGDVTTIGYLLLKNLDDTNYVEVSSDNANANKIAKILPGDLALFTPGTVTLYATAHTAGVKLLVLALEQ